MKKLLFIAFLILSQLLFAKLLSDIKGAKDSNLVGRFKGSVIVAYKHYNFDKFTLPLSPLKKIEGRDSHNNNLYAPKQSKVLKGEHIRLVYLLPKGVSPLEVIENYRDEIAQKGGKVLFECENAKCGGDPHRASSGGGGDMSLTMFFEDEERVLTYNKDFSVGYCALLDRITEQQYINAKVNDSYISVLSYTIQKDGYCKSTNGRVVAIVDIVTPKEHQNKMVVIKADNMKKAIDSQGKIALYGIYFDTNKAVIKPESKATIDEIAKMLKDNPTLNILIVGHTDNQGEFNYNINLSNKRAKAVKNRLVSKYGIKASRLRAVGVSYACPKATNDTDEGRAKNRRVVLVKDK